MAYLFFFALHERTTHSIALELWYYADELQVVPGTLDPWPEVCLPVLDIYVGELHKVSLSVLQRREPLTHIVPELLQIGTELAYAGVPASVPLYLSENESDVQKRDIDSTCARTL